MDLFGRVLRRAVFRLARGAVRRRGLLAATFVIVAAVIAISTLNLVSIPLLSSHARGSGDTGPAYQASESEPNAISSYIRGLQTGDARLVWDAYSDRAARDLQQRGVNIDATQRQLDQSRQNGNIIQQVQYVGNYPIPNGSMHFYVIARAGRSRGDVAYVPYVFTLDSAGKIERID